MVAVASTCPDWIRMCIFVTPDAQMISLFRLPPPADDAQISGPKALDCNGGYQTRQGLGAVQRSTTAALRGRPLRLHPGFGSDFRRMRPGDLNQHHTPAVPRRSTPPKPVTLKTTTEIRPVHMLPALIERIAATIGAHAGHGDNRCQFQSLAKTARPGGSSEMWSEPGGRWNPSQRAPSNRSTQRRQVSPDPVWRGENVIANRANRLLFGEHANRCARQWHLELGAHLHSCCRSQASRPLYLVCCCC